MLATYFIVFFIVIQPRKDLKRISNDRTVLIIEKKATDQRVIAKEFVEEWSREYIDTLYWCDPVKTKDDLLRNVFWKLRMHYWIERGL